MQDPLTGLPNRAQVHEAMERLLSESEQKNKPFGIILCDIDRFKLINYGYGNGAGDAVLQQVAGAAKRKLRARDLIGRWGGQQFACVLPGIDCEKTDALAEMLRALIEGLSLSINPTHVTASFGVACYPADGLSVQRLLAAAEAALFQAKDAGRNRVVHASRLQQQVFGMGAMLDLALTENRVVPAYQPIINIKTGRIVAEEALARIVTHDGGVVEAEQFIEPARQLQLTYKIDRAIIKSTIERCAELVTRRTPLTHFVNISGNLLRHPNVVQELLELVRQRADGLGRSAEAQRLVIEITERELLGDLKAAREMIRPFMECGLRLALDDFGSGYSSFQYLADLPVSFLKIEGGLIRRLHEPKVRAIVEGIHKTASDLGLTTLAECVENEATAAVLQRIGIPWAQGHYYDRPRVGSGYTLPFLRVAESRL